MDSERKNRTVYLEGINDDEEKSTARMSMDMRTLHGDAYSDPPWPFAQAVVRARHPDAEKEMPWPHLGFGAPDPDRREKAMVRGEWRRMLRHTAGLLTEAQLIRDGEEDWAEARYRECCDEALTLFRRIVTCDWETWEGTKE